MAKVFVAPGNAGTALEPSARNVDVAADDVPGLLTFALAERIDLTIVGPEAPLVLGVADAFAAEGLRCFGPSRLAARLEGSKAFTKDFLKRHGIPTAAYATFTRNDFDPAWIRAQKAPLVVKADGLAAGKGVVICATTEEAVETTQAMFAGRFGPAGDKVVVEEFLEGEEASFIAMVDGSHVLPLATSQDHKRLGDGDAGPNTGGMGAYSPAPVVTPAHPRARRCARSSCRRVRGAGRRGHSLHRLPLRGPHDRRQTARRRCSSSTAASATRRRSRSWCGCESDLTALLRGRARRPARHGRGRLGSARGRRRRDRGRRLSRTVRKGDVIDGLDAAATLPGKVFHAGTATADGNVVITNGGRVLCAVGARRRPSRAAQRDAYDLVDAIAGTACSTAATSVIAPWSASVPGRRRPVKPAPVQGQPCTDPTDALKPARIEMILLPAACMTIAWPPSGSIRIRSEPPADS